MLKSGDGRAAQGSFDALYRLGEARGDKTLKAEGLQGLGLAAESMGFPQEALSYMRAAVAMAEEAAEDGDLLPEILTDLARLELMGRGEDPRATERAFAAFERAAGLFEKAGRADEAAHVYLLYGEALIGVEDFDFTLSLLTRARDMWDALGKEADAALAQRQIARTKAAAALFDAAAVEIGDEIKRWQALNDRPHETEALQGLTWVEVQRGRLGDAERAGQLSLTYARALGDKFLEAESLRQLGLVAAMGDRRGEACLLYNQALTLYRAVGEKASEERLLGIMAEIACVPKEA